MTCQLENDTGILSETDLKELGLWQDLDNVIEDFNPIKELKQYSFPFVMMKYLFGCKTYQHSNLMVNEKNNKFVYEHLYEMLKDIHNLFVKGNVNYIISDGTLLGAYRDGGFIEGDDDIDIRVDEYDWERCVQLINYLGSKYIIKKMNDKFYRVINKVYIPGEPLTVDIASSKRPETNVWPDWTNVDYLFDKPLDTIMLNDLEVYGPNKEDIVPYLEDTYGSNWNVKMCHNFKYRKFLILINVIFLLLVGVFIYMSVKKSKFYIIPSVILFILAVISLTHN